MAAKITCQDCGQEFEAKRSDARRCADCKRLQRKAYLREYEHGKRRGRCAVCGGDIGARAKHCLACENKGRSQRYAREGTWNWREGRTRARGYVYVRIRVGTPGDGKGQLYAPEHRLVWERAHGRALPKNWVVHHLNGVKDDNRPENLFAISRSDHHRHSREHIKPYENRIRQLEKELAALRQLRLGDASD